MVALAATAMSANPNSWWSGLKYDRCMLQLMTGTVTEVCFPQVSMKISTTTTLQHLRVLRWLTFALSMRLLDQSIVIICECFHPLWNNVSVNQAQQEEFQGPAHSPTSHPRHGRAVYPVLYSIYCCLISAPPTQLYITSNVLFYGVVDILILISVHIV